MAQGTYDYDYDAEGQEVTTQNSIASNVFLHGGGSLLSRLSDGPLLTIGIGTTVRDLEFRSGGRAIDLYGTAPILMERIKILGSSLRGIYAGTQVTLRDVEIQGADTGIVIGDRLTIERGIIHDVATAIVSNDPNTVVDLMNLLIFGTSDIAIDLAMSAGGTIRSTTIADSGTDTGNGPRAFKCPPAIYNLTIRSSIIWAPGATPRVPIDDTCTLVSTIAGPTAVPGATNVDPLFVNAAQRDYHLLPNSPARDVADSGPSIDFEGDPRPRGARFDIGADEAP
jgi:hypothetical protein